MPRANTKNPTKPDYRPTVLEVVRVLKRVKGDGQAYIPLWAIPIALEMGWRPKPAEENKALIEIGWQPFV